MRWFEYQNDFGIQINIQKLFYPKIINSFLFKKN